MLITLAVVVFFASIFVFFSQEFIRTFKRLFAIKGAKLILPLAAASWFVYKFELWVLWAIYYYREVLLNMVTLVTHILPFKRAAPGIALILVLTLLSVVPVFIADFIFKKRTFRPYPYPYLTSSLIWVLNAVVLVVFEKHLHIT